MTFFSMLMLFGAVIWAHARAARLEQRLMLLEVGRFSEPQPTRAHPTPKAEPAPVAEPAQAFPAESPADRLAREWAEPHWPDQAWPDHPDRREPEEADVAIPDSELPENNKSTGTKELLSRLSFLFEDIVGRRLPIWAGGITLAVAGVLLVNYANSIGFFARVLTPGIQCLLGTTFGLLLIAGAEWSRRQQERIRDPRVAQALAGAGLSTLYAAITVATNIYGLIPPLAGFGAFAVVTGGALWLALRHGPAAALLGLVGGLAMPALTLSPDDHMPLLAGYLTLLTGGLIGVARMRQWNWLAAASLAGAVCWGLWLVLTRNVPQPADTLALGGFILMFALIIPGFALSQSAADGRQRLLRGGAAIIGTVQLALLLAMGDYRPLDWALFALIASAGQWFAWRDRDFALIPSVSALLAVLLLFTWPSPQNGVLLAAGLAMLVIHAVPLLLRLWSQPARLQRAIELSALGAAVPLITMVHYSLAWGSFEHVLAASSAAGALVPLIGALLGRDPARRGHDARLGVLLGSSWALATLALVVITPLWQAPLWIGGMALALLMLARPAGDARLEGIAAGYALLAIMMLIISGGLPGRDDLLALAGQIAQPRDWTAMLRWSGMAMVAAGFLWRSQQRWLGFVAQIAAAALVYGTAAQLLPALALPLFAPVAALVLAIMLVRTGRQATPTIATLACIAALWAMAPLAQWLSYTGLALFGWVAPAEMWVLPGVALRQLLLPTLMSGGVLWMLRESFDRRVLTGGSAVLAAMGLIAVHCLFRAGFGAWIGEDFVQYGLGQRLAWAGLLLGTAMLAHQVHVRRDLPWAGPAAMVLLAMAAAHLTWFSLMLHNPLWSAQAVGRLPVINLLLPLFAGLPLCLMLLNRWAGEWAQGTPVAAWVARVTPMLRQAQQVALISMIALFAWASLRHAFHGSLLVVPGVTGTEDILRSLLGIVLAIAYLLWGICRRDYAWRIASLVLMLAAVVKVFLFDASALDGLLRIASFMALGFSLIGIGWLYSRQLRQDGS